MTWKQRFIAALLLVLAALFVGSIEFVWVEVGSDHKTPVKVEKKEIDISEDCWK